MRKARAGIFTLSSSSIIVCEALLNIVMIFLDTFLVSKLLKLTPGNYTSIALFNFIFYVVIGLTALVITPLMKKINKSFFLSAGALVLTGVFVAVYLLADKLDVYIWLFGALSGLGYGLFDASFNNLVGEVISSKHQTIFFSVKNIVIFMTKTVFPLVLGLIIDMGSFPLICIVIALVCVTIFIFSFLIKAKQNVSKSFNLIKFIKKVKNGGEDTKPLKVLYLSAIFRGFCFDIIATVFTVLIFLSASGSDFTIGLFQTIFTATQLVSMFIFMKCYHKNRSKWFLFISLGFILASSIPVFFIHNLITILIFFGVYLFCRVFITTVSDMRRTGVVRQLSMHANLWEHNAVYSVIYGLCRGSSYLLFLLWLVVPADIMLNIILAVNMLAYTGYAISLYFLEQLLILQDIKWKNEHPEAATATQPAPESALEKPIPVKELAEADTTLPKEIQKI